MDGARLQPHEVCYDWCIVLFTKSRILLVVLGLSLIVVVTIGAQTLLSLLPVEQDVYSWNQKVTLTVETEDGVFSSSTVQRVIWSRNSAKSFNPAAQTWILELKGEMPYVSLSSGNQVFSLFGKSGDLDLLAKVLPFASSHDRQISPTSLNAVGTSDASVLEIDLNSEFFPLLVQLDPEVGISSISVFNPEGTSILVERTFDGQSIGRIPIEMPWFRELSSFRGVGPGTFHLNNVSTGVFTLNQNDLYR